MKSLFALAALVLSTIVSAQNPQPLGTLVATVTDASGAKIPGVTVTATGPGGVTTGVTNTSGAVSFRLSEGTYTVTATLRGFIDQPRQVTVKSGEATSLSITMQVAPQRFLAPSPSPFERERNVDIQANSFTLQGNVVLYRGNVRMRTESVEVRADEIDFNTVTRSASARGNVTIQVLSIGPRVTPLSN